MKNNGSYIWAVLKRRWRAALQGGCAAVILAAWPCQAQITVLGKNTNDTVLAKFFQQNANATTLIQALNAVAGGANVFNATLAPGSGGGGGGTPGDGVTIVTNAAGKLVVSNWFSALTGKGSNNIFTASTSSNATLVPDGTGSGIAVTIYSPGSSLFVHETNANAIRRDYLMSAGSLGDQETDWDWDNQLYWLDNVNTNTIIFEDLNRNPVFALTNSTDAAFFGGNIYGNGSIGIPNGGTLGSVTNYLSTNGLDFSSGPDWKVWNDAHSNYYALNFQNNTLLQSNDFCGLISNIFNLTPPTAGSPGLMLGTIQIAACAKVSGIGYNPYYVSNTIYITNWFFHIVGEGNATTLLQPTHDNMYIFVCGGPPGISIPGVCSFEKIRLQCGANNYTNNGGIQFSNVGEPAVKWCEINEPGSAGIRFSDSINNQFTWPEIDDTWYVGSVNHSNSCGILIDGTANLLETHIRRCMFAPNGCTAIIVSNTVDYLDIQGCRFYQAGGTSYSAINRTCGIDLWKPTTNALISGNVFNWGPNTNIGPCIVCEGLTLGTNYNLLVSGNVCDSPLGTNFCITNVTAQNVLILNNWVAGTNIYPASNTNIIGANLQGYQQIPTNQFVNTNGAGAGAGGFLQLINGGVVYVATNFYTGLTNSLIASGLLQFQNVGTNFASMSGSNLSHLNGTNLEGTLAAVSGANLTSLNGSQVTSGTIASGRMALGSSSQPGALQGDNNTTSISGGVISVNGANLTGIPYTGLTGVPTFSAQFGVIGAGPTNIVSGVALTNIQSQGIVNNGGQTNGGGETQITNSVFRWTNNFASYTVTSNGLNWLGTNGQTAALTNGTLYMKGIPMYLSQVGSPSMRGTGYVKRYGDYLYDTGNSTYYAYGNGASDFNIVDVHNPLNMLLLSSNNCTNRTTHGAENFFVIGNYLYYQGFTNNDFVIFDVSSKTNPVEVGYISNNITLGQGQNMVAAGKVAYSASFSNANGTITAIDFSCPTNPVVLSVVTNASMKLTSGEQIKGRYLYLDGYGSSGASFTDGSVMVWDVSSPTNMIPVCTNLPNIYALGENDIEDNYLYVASATNLDVFNVSCPTNIVRVGRVRVDDGTKTTYNCQVNGQFAYVANQFSIWTIDVSDPTHPSILAITTPAAALGPLDDLHIYGDYLYCCSHGGASVNGQILCFQISGAVMPGITAGSVYTWNAQVGKQLDVMGPSVLHGGLEVGGAGIETPGNITGSTLTAGFGGFSVGSNGVITGNGANVTNIPLSAIQTNGFNGGTAYAITNDGSGVLKATNIVAGGGGSGTVTSVSGDGVVTSGTITTSGSLGLVNAAQNSVLAGPPNGGAGAPSYQTAPTFSGVNITGLSTIPTTWVGTNFPLNQIYTNASGTVQYAQEAFQFTPAAAAGAIGVVLMVSTNNGANYSNYDGYLYATLITTLISPSTNSVGSAIPTNGWFYFTNLCTAGNAVAIVPGSGKLTTIGNAIAAGVLLASQSNLFIQSNIVPATASLTAFTNGLLLGCSTPTLDYKDFTNSTFAFSPPGTGRLIDGTCLAGHVTMTNGATGGQNTVFSPLFSINAPTGVSWTTNMHCKVSQSVQYAWETGSWKFPVLYCSNGISAGGAVTNCTVLQGVGNTATSSSGIYGFDFTWSPPSQ